MTTPIDDTVGGDLPFPLGGVVASGQAASSSLDPEFDVFVAGLSFNLHITKDGPYRRETAEWRKQQIDQSNEAGEQTLSNWWLRSQSSFHGGAGIKYLDTMAGVQNDTNRIRFDDSRGVDVWTEGEIKRLPDTGLVASTSDYTWVHATEVSGVSYVLYGWGSTLKAVQGDSTVVTYSYGSVQPIQSLVIDGVNYYVACADGIYRGPIGSPATVGTKLWDVPAGASVLLGWVKQRLMAAVNHSVYELAGTGPALPAALYSHPNTAWRWSAWSDAPDGIIASGAAGLQSAIFTFTISDSSGAPRLQPGISLAELPTGEVIRALYFYVGSRLAIGTSLGLRIGDFDTYYGTFKYGPLTVDRAGPVTALAGRGSYIYGGCTIDGEPSLLRVDIGLPVDTGPVYAWAPDLRVPSPGTVGAVTALTVAADGRLRFGVGGYGVVAELSTFTSTRDCWLRTARIRMNTVEPKTFRYGRVRTEGSGAITVRAQTDVAAVSDVYTGLSDVASYRFVLAQGAAEWVSLTFVLTGAAKLTSYQVLALPAQPRQRLFALPVQVFDSERNRHGRPVGYPGRAKALLDAMEQIETGGDEVTVQCPVLGLDAVRCTVERIEFTQPSPPTGGKSYGLGGYANLVFRTST